MGIGGPASLKLFYAYKHRSVKNVPAENIECDRWSYADLDDKFLQKFYVWHSVPASSAHRLCRLMSPGGGGCLTGSFIFEE